jgi:hypothetical protein
MEVVSMHLNACRAYRNADTFVTRAAAAALPVAAVATMSVVVAASAEGAVARYLPGGSAADTSGRATTVRPSAPGGHAETGTRWLLGRGIGGFGSGQAARAGAGGSYAGLTSQQAPIVFEMAKGGGRVAKVVAFWTAACSGGTFMQGETMRVMSRAPRNLRPGPTVLVGGAMGNNGAFRASGTGASDIPGINDRVTEAVNGKLGRRSGAGTLEARVEVKNGAGAVVDRCRTGRVRWSAPAPQSLYYGGSTSEGQPTVLQLAADRQSVKALRLVWFADCSDGGSLAINDALDDFPVTGGGFGDTFSQTYPANDGGQEKYDYEIAGNVGARSASGTFHVVLTATDPAGAVTATCESPVLRWNAR